MSVTDLFILRDCIANSNRYIPDITEDVRQDLLRHDVLTEFVRSQGDVFIQYSTVWDRLTHPFAYPKDVKKMQADLRIFCDAKERELRRCEQTSTYTTNRATSYTSSAPAGSSSRRSSSTSRTESEKVLYADDDISIGGLTSQPSSTTHHHSGGWSDYSHHGGCGGDSGGGYSDGGSSCGGGGD